MKNSVRLALAVLVLLASLAWSPKSAEAVPGTCEAYGTQHCSRDGQVVGCFWSNGARGTCVCDGGTRLWDCS